MADSTQVDCGVDCRTLFAIALLTAASSGDAAQTRGYDDLSPSQRRLLQPWGADRFDSAPERFRIVFERLTGRLAPVLLSDPENGEVLGAAMDLIDAVEPPERQPARPDASDDRLSVVLASGARDRLRRSAEFERVVDGMVRDQAVFEHAGPQAIRIAIASPGSSGEVSMSRR
jgi:hypothetical protein